jgi:hypothetical protein
MKYARLHSDMQRNPLGLSPTAAKDAVSKILHDLLSDEMLNNRQKLMVQQEIDFWESSK